MKKDNLTNITDDWRMYQRGVDYKNRINLYSRIDEYYRYFSGDQWADTQTEILSTPVFNVIKPNIRYKTAVIMQNETAIVYSSNNKFDDRYAEYEDIANKLTKYAQELHEQLKMDYTDEQTLETAAITGDGIQYFYYNPATDEIDCEIIDSTNYYPYNPNVADVQDQEGIQIVFRRSVESFKTTAKANKIPQDEIDMIASDEDTYELAGDNAKIEIDNGKMCNGILTLWRDTKTGTIWQRISTQNACVMKENDTTLTLYPLAKMCWENVKNSAFGMGDVQNMLSNQDYINLMGAMIQNSTTFSSFPKMVYDRNAVDNPSNQIGVAIGVEGMPGQRITDIIDYINPAGISGDAFQMFDKTITLTKELNGASDGALGNIDPTQASGRAIIATMEQNAMPLDTIRRRYYNMKEDVAKIWADIWKAYSPEGKRIVFKDENGEMELGQISAKAFSQMMLAVKIDVGPDKRFNNMDVEASLDNLLKANYIPFPQYVEWLPDDTILPKVKMQEWIKQEAERMAQQQAMQPPIPPPQMM